MHVHVRWNSVLSIWPKTLVYSSPKSSKYSLSGMTIRLWQHHLTGKKQTNFNNPMKLSKRPKSMALAGCPSQNWSKRGRSQSCYLYVVDAVTIIAIAPNGHCMCWNVMSCIVSNASHVMHVLDFWQSASCLAKTCILLWTNIAHWRTPDCQLDDT